MVFFGRIGFPPRTITGKDYFNLRDEIKIGSVLLSKTYYEFSNIYNPTKLKHAAIYVGAIKNDKVLYVAEATEAGTKFTDLVTFMLHADEIVIVHPKFIREDVEMFNRKIQKAANTFVGTPYDYIFKEGAKAFYCFELVIAVFNSAYEEIRFKQKTIFKSKMVYDDNTFFDKRLFDTKFDSRGNLSER